MQGSVQVDQFFRSYSWEFYREQSAEVHSKILVDGFSTSKQTAEGAMASGPEISTSMNGMSEKEERKSPLLPL